MGIWSHRQKHGKFTSFYFLKVTCKNIIDFKNKKKLLLTKEELKSYQGAKVCYI